MTDWDTGLKAAEAGAERKQAFEEEAEARFRARHATAQAQGDATAPTDSDEFHAWMAARHATDLAWGNWATLMDAKLASGSDSPNRR